MLGLEPWDLPCTPVIFGVGPFDFDVLYVRITPFLARTVLLTAISMRVILVLREEVFIENMNSDYRTSLNVAIAIFDFCVGSELTLRLFVSLRLRPVHAVFNKYKL